MRSIDFGVTNSLYCTIAFNLVIPKYDATNVTYIGAAERSDFWVLDSVQTENYRLTASATSDITISVVCQDCDDTGILFSIVVKTPNKKKTNKLVHVYHENTKHKSNFVVVRMI